VAKKRKKKRRWLRSLLIFTGLPLVVWFVAFLLWFFWYDIAGYVGRDEGEPKNASRATQTSAQVKPLPATRSEEKILNEDRKRLEDIINKRR
jgi:cytoskeletal protein RodZ